MLMEVMTATHPSGVARHHFLMANGAIFCYRICLTNITNLQSYDAILIQYWDYSSVNSLLKFTEISAVLY